VTHSDPDKHAAEKAEAEAWDAWNESVIAMQKAQEHWKEAVAVMRMAQRVAEGAAAAEAEEEAKRDA
jgi:hypothetical protein